jgi:hypothetical protein
MSATEDWFWWIVAALAAAAFIGYFAFVGKELFTYMRSLVSTIQNWPQTRRTMVEAEAKAGGRYPWWFRAIRVTLILAMVGLAVVLVWRKFNA